MMLVYQYRMEKMAPSCPNRHGMREYIYDKQFSWLETLHLFDYWIKQEWAIQVCMLKVQIRWSLAQVARAKEPLPPKFDRPLIDYIQLKNSKQHEYENRTRISAGTATPTPQVPD
jgi:hypothetical protein